ncbi:MAG: hypothetical protein WBA12_06415 [Catalinimonas sp.]
MEKQLKNTRDEKATPQTQVCPRCQANAVQPCHAPADTQCPRGPERKTNA